LAAINLTKTQNGYVPLVDRFKSFDQDKQPITDQIFYFDNQANRTLEHATLDLLYQNPFVRQRILFQKTRFQYIVDNEGKLLVGNNKFVIGVTKTC